MTVPPGSRDIASDAPAGRWEEPVARGGQHCGFDPCRRRVGLLRETAPARRVLGAPRRSPTSTGVGPRRADLECAVDCRRRGTGGEHARRPSSLDYLGLNAGKPSLPARADAGSSETEFSRLCSRPLLRSGCVLGSECVAISSVERVLQATGPPRLLPRGTRRGSPAGVLGGDPHVATRRTAGKVALVPWVKQAGRPPPHASEPSRLY